MTEAREEAMAICVRVTNNAIEEGISDTYAGIEYTFHYGKPIKIPLEAAQHILGYASGKINFDHVCKRWGWNVKGSTMEKARDWYEAMRAEPVKMRLIEMPSDMDEAAFEQAVQYARIKEPDPTMSRSVHE